MGLGHVGPAAACAAVFLLAWGASATAAGQRADEALLGSFADLPGDGDAWAEASWPGHTWVVALVLSAAAVAALALRERAALLGLAVAALAVPLVWLVKEAVGRARPDTAEAAELAGQALPSGHAALATVAYGAVALLLVPRLLAAGAPRWLRPAATGLWVGLALATGLARVAAGVHWPSDVVAGWAFGGLVLAVAHAAPGLAPRLWPRHGSSADDPGG